MRRLLFALAACLLLAATPCLAFDPPADGTYAIDGFEPHGAYRYNGTATLYRHGGGYAFEGVVDGQPYDGVGLYDSASGILSLSYAGKDRKDMGVTQLTVRGTVLEGRWMILGGKDGTVGTETWTLKKK